MDIEYRTKMFYDCLNIVDECIKKVKENNKEMDLIESINFFYIFSKKWKKAFYKSRYYLSVAERIHKEATKHL